jgi:glutamyl-tRNA synthetase
MSMRVRFPPSPTGYLHVGGARTALFNWLLARKHGGALVLRIEDTDRDRSSEAHVQAILDGLAWLGLDWDEGPLFQSAGVERHRAEALRLLDEGKAYRDFTEPAALRAEAEARGIGHPSILAREKADAMAAGEADERAAAGEPHALRLRVPEGRTRWRDLVHGEMDFANADIDDLVILRSDGSPIYNLAVVSDDAEQGITHVIRGDDHLSNTPKQILLYEALGLHVPTFGHVPMILGADGKRLSKRHGATAVAEYATEGILPEAMVNFLALLGWNPGDDREVMTRAELVDAFSMERVQKKSAVFDTEKLSWLNGQYLARKPTAEVVPLVRERLAARGVDASAWAGWRLDERDGAVQVQTGPADEVDGWLEALVALLQIRARSVDEIADQALPFLVEDPPLEEKAVRKRWLRDPEAVVRRLGELARRLADVAWREEPLEEALRALAAERKVGAGALIHPLRVAVTGQGRSPGIFEVLVLLGRERSLARIARARARIPALAEDSA